MNDKELYDTDDDDSEDVLKVRQSLRRFRMIRAIAFVVCVVGMVIGAVAFYLIAESSRPR